MEMQKNDSGYKRGKIEHKLGNYKEILSKEGSATYLLFQKWYNLSVNYNNKFAQTIECRYCTEQS